MFMKPIVDTGITYDWVLNESHDLAAQLGASIVRSNPNVKGFSVHQSKVTQEKEDRRMKLVVFFDDPQDAMLFKLSWNGLP